MKLFTSLSVFVVISFKTLILIFTSRNVIHIFVCYIYNIYFNDLTFNKIQLHNEK